MNTKESAGQGINMFFIMLVLFVACQATIFAAPPFTISRETTYLTKPLKTDGTVDYLAALNSELSQGVTKENNAVIDILQAIGPSVIPETVRSRLFTILDIDLPAEGTYFVRAKTVSDELHKQFNDVLQKNEPWKESNYPKLAAWIKQNEISLNKFVEASKKTKYYFPLVVSDPDKNNFMLGTISLSPLDVSSGIKALIVRAYLTIGNGNLRQAWQDILAVHRLGVLLGEGTTTTDRLLANAITRLACNATCTLANSGKLSAMQTKRMLRNMKALGPVPEPALGRYMMLDTVSCFAMKPREGFNTILERVNEPIIAAIEAGQVDFDTTLKYINQFYDKLEQGLNMSSFAERKAAIVVTVEEAYEFTVSAYKDYRTGDLEKQKKAIGPKAMGILMPPIEKIHGLCQQTKVKRDLSSVAIALAAYQSIMDKYPDQLSQLSPKYLPKIPTDSFIGKDLIYKATEDGYLLYSVGVNMTDDGGKSKDEGGDDLIVKKPRHPLE